MIAESAAPEVLHVWTLFSRASEEARRRGDRRTGTEHLLLSLLEEPSIDDLVGVSLQRARRTLDALDREAFAALGLGLKIDAPPLPMRAVPEKPTVRALMGRDRLRPTPAAKKALEDAVKPNRRKTQVSARQVLDQILALEAPDPAAVLLRALGVNVSAAKLPRDGATSDG